MAKNIRLTDEELIELSRKRIMDGVIKLYKDDRKATLAFTPIAWTKMYALVDAFDKEVQWHGLVSRLDENTFIVEDILIFPHEASACTVVSDQEEYEEWMNDLSDEQFNACRFHGHSHVNMGVTPSVTDMMYRKNIFENFSTNPAPDEDQFYIFIIVNKKREFSGQIYDITNNAIYEKEEINLEILANGDYLKDFIAEAKRIVKNPTPPQAKNATTNNGKPSGMASPQGTSVGHIQQTSIYPAVCSETDEQWRKRVYGGGELDSADKNYPAGGFKGGTYGK